MGGQPTKITPGACTCKQPKCSPAAAELQKGKKPADTRRSGNLKKMFTGKPSARASSDVTSSSGRVLQVHESPGSNSYSSGVDVFDECASCKCNHKRPPDLTSPLHLDRAMEVKPLNNHQIRVLTLENNCFQEDILYRLKKGWYLEFRVGPSLFGSDIDLYTNIPAEGSEFDRKTYRRLDWIREWSSDDMTNDDSSLSCLLQMNKAGSFHYYYEFKGQKKGSGYVCVDPSLVAGGEEIPLESLQTVSVLTKCLGPLYSWKTKLQVAKESGYNMVHFTPIQELGGSRSSYSLQNQLVLNPSFNYDKRVVTFDDIRTLTEEMDKEWNVLSICDIVLNHTANESPWLMKHPESTYNLVNCPYLRPAYLLDYTLYQFSLEVSKGMWEFSGVPVIVDNEEHLGSIRHALLAVILPRVKIHELFQLNVDKILNEFQNKVRASPPPLVNKSEMNEELTLIPDPEFRRLGATIDMNKALKVYNKYRNDCFDEDTRLQRCSYELKLKLESLNSTVFDEIQGHLVAAIDNCIAGIRYFRVQPDGPKLTSISITNPLVPRYFKDYEGHSADEVLYSPNGRFVMSHNGWVMGGDPLKNFAGPDSNTYLRRELIAWGDSVKLRYGEEPKDCPFLWNHMRRYVEQTATVFHGVRLDNCHSTPLHVAEYLLDAARKVRPDLYVVAELFTNSDATDNIFVNRLGITSLIREAMSAWDSHELGRLVYRYGGEPVGAFIKPLEQPLRSTVAHALFMDQTHDNPSPIEKRSVYDLLPSAALVSIACCASGSNMGYDLLVPHHIHVVDEERQYMSWSDEEIGIDSGIVAGKKALNELHYSLGKRGFDQVYVDQIDSDIVCVTRHNSTTHDTVVLMSYTSFSTPLSYKNGLGKGITVSGKIEEILIEASLEYKLSDIGNEKFVKDVNKINGLNNFKLNLKQNTTPKDCVMLDLVPSNDKTTKLNFTANFKPGCVVAISISAIDKTKSAVNQLLADINLVQAVSRLTLTDMNHILFRCAEEDEGNVYDVPGYGKLVYCGLQGFMSVLDNVVLNNDLGHPLCSNLRNGFWILDYIVGRLKRKEFENSSLYQFGDFLEQYLQPLRNLPSYLVPSFFEFSLRKVYNALLNRTWSLMPGDIKNGSTFCKSLALASVQFAGIVKSSPLPTLSPNLLAPLLRTQAGPDGKNRPECVSLAAGLPHFSSGYMRNWGRDTFISLRGLLLLTGRYEDAKYIILAFGGCLRHGLIPNLLDGGQNPRYNCRDAVWWWLYVIQQYVVMVPGGISILDDPVNRIFPTDDSKPTSVEQPLYEVIQEVLSIHFQGLCFRERNAGIAIDAHMKSQGFDNQIGVQPLTGFIFGGNEWNCGTWMDKMGSSDKAGNRGRPATPRDGSAIELVALSKSVIGWLAKLNKANQFKYSGVTRKNKDGSVTEWTYEEWNEKIQINFEAYFWIPEDNSRNQIEPHPELINRRGIYKDTVGASNKWGDYQLRCNYPVAMVVAPELFNPDNARVALQTVSNVLLGPLGMKTLDPSDWAYDGFYNNDNDTTDSKIANGFNYHQGPEWLWPVGFFLRAKLIFSSNKKETSSEIQGILSKHYEHLKTSLWRGLPELTNKDGAFCAGSCPTQAWSIATILEILLAISNLNQN